MPSTSAVARRVAGRGKGKAKGKVKGAAPAKPIQAGKAIDTTQAIAPGTQAKKLGGTKIDRALVNLFGESVPLIGQRGGG